MKAPPRRKGNAENVIIGRVLGDASMKAPPRRKGNLSLNQRHTNAEIASMKALPKRKGNGVLGLWWSCGSGCLNESPSQKEGKSFRRPDRRRSSRLNESPSQKEGKFPIRAAIIASTSTASMKALPKRKGNDEGDNAPDDERFSLNESPSQKEGKFGLFRNQFIRRNKASMKALPKRKGNLDF